MKLVAFIREDPHRWSVKSTVPRLVVDVLNRENPTFARYSMITTHVNDPASKRERMRAHTCICAPSPSPANDHGASVSRDTASRRIRRVRGNESAGTPTSLFRRLAISFHTFARRTTEDVIAHLLGIAGVKKQKKGKTLTQERRVLSLSLPSFSRSRGGCRRRPAAIIEINTTLKGSLHRVYGISLSGWTDGQIDGRRFADGVWWTTLSRSRRGRFLNSAWKRARKESPLDRVVRAIRFHCHKRTQEANACHSSQRRK